MTNSDLKNTVQEAFAQYAGAVIQSRALVDVRDCVKPSARQIYYAMFTDNYVHSKPFNKTLKSIGSSMRFYIHGDSSCEGIIMRSGQPFAMRYPIIEVEGDQRVLVENHRGISAYSTERILINVNFGTVCVCGCGLRLIRMTKEQLVIRGRIDAVSLQRRSGK